MFTANQDSSDEYTRSARLWFADGNIIFLIENKTGFRVHRGVLVIHSTVFGDAFGIQQPDDVLLYDGCQVMSLAGDSLVDWERLLLFMYQPLA